MPRKGPKNSLGLTPRQYELRFAGWRVPKALLRDLWGQDRSFIECQVYFSRHYGDARPRTTKVQGIGVARKVKATADRLLIFRLMRQRWTAEAQEFLLSFVEEDIRAALRMPREVASELTQEEINARGAGVYVDRGLTQEQLFEGKYGRLVDNKVYRKDEHGRLVESAIEHGENVDAPWAGVFTKF